MNCLKEKIVTNLSVVNNYGNVHEKIGMIFFLLSSFHLFKDRIVSTDQDTDYQVIIDI